jgi:hypothetical protein
VHPCALRGVAVALPAASRDNQAMRSSTRLPLGEELERGPALRDVTVNGRAVAAYTGETVAAVLLAAGITATRRTRGGAARGVFCGMGFCHDCLVVIDGTPNRRACVSWVREGMAIECQDGLGAEGFAAVQ